MITYKQYNFCRKIGLPPIPHVERYFSKYAYNKKHDAIAFAGLDDFLLLRDYLFNGEYSKYNQLAKKYFPREVKEYIRELTGGKDYFTLNINKEEYKIPIKYKNSLNNKDPYAQLNFLYTTDGKYFKPSDITIYSKVLIDNNRALDASLAHELAHAKRFITGKGKKYLIENNAKNVMHEEFWADRGIRKMLPIVGEHYNNRKQRKKTIIANQASGSRRDITGRWTKFGEFYDRLLSFSNRT